MSQVGSISRRKFVQASLAVTGSLVLPLSWGRNNFAQLLKQSDLVYITPLKSNGKESRCQAEIWFVYSDRDIYVCTNTSSWRCVAANKGLQQARIWVGDVGVWANSEGRYKQLPQLDAVANIVKDQTKHQQALALFADKYPLGWLRWGSVFENGLADGSRSLIRYTPTV